MQDQKGLDLLKLELEQITKERNMLEAEIMKLKQIIEENAKREAKDISVTSDTPLRITELTEENESSSMRCYTYGEEVPDLPSNLVVINKNTGQGNKNKGLLSDEALELIIIGIGSKPFNIKIPFVPSLTEAKVVHDGLVHSFPSALLVEGDVIEMIYGDIAPCRIKVISQDLSSDLNNKEQDNKE
ncbi:13332_t:CDS:2, partial [Entrophospora sp. SA101]